MKDKKSIVFGSREWLVDKFADISTATKVSRNSDEFKLVQAAVDGIRTAKNNAYVFEVFRTSGYANDKKVKLVVAHIVLGLNGPGKQTDYLRALQNLLKDGRFAILDSWLDVCDDLWDFLIVTDAK